MAPGVRATMLAMPWLEACMIASGRTFFLSRTISLKASKVPLALSREMTTIFRSGPPISFQFFTREV